MSHEGDGGTLTTKQTDPEKPAGAPKKRKKRLSPEDRKEEIIEHAIKYFADVGFDGGTRQFAAKAGVTQSLLYRYFSSKDDLIWEVYKHVYLDRWKPEWNAILTDRSRPLRVRMQEFYEQYTDAIFDRTWLRIYLFSSLNGAQINRWYIEVVETKILHIIVNEFRVQAGLKLEHPPSPEEMELAWLLQGGIFYYGIRKFIYNTPTLRDKSLMIRNALDLYFYGSNRLHSLDDL